MDDRLEQLLQTASSQPGRRAVLRGLMGAIGAASISTLTGEQAGNARRRRRRRRIQCRRNNQCEAPLNPCQEARCRNNRCRTKNLADGTACGGGLVCQDGACLCPDGVCTIQVTPDELGPWVALVELVDVDTSVLAFQSGPGTPPFGDGSVNLTAEDGTFVLATFQYAGVSLSEITALTYSTYQPSSNSDDPGNAGILVLAVDFFGQRLPGDLIQYIPSQSGTPVQQDAWQTWDAIDGGVALWSYLGGCGCSWPDSNIPGETPRTWAEITSSYKLATITQATDPMVGVLVTNVDAGATFAENINEITFGTTSGTTRYIFGPG